MEGQSVPIVTAVVGAIGAFLLSWLFPVLFPATPKWFAQSGVFTGIVLVVVAFCLPFLPEWATKPSLLPLMAAVLGFITLGVGVIGITDQRIRGLTIENKELLSAPPSAATATTEADQTVIDTTPPGTIRSGLHVSDMRFSFTDLQKDRHSELTMRVFNGTGSVVEFYKLHGQITFNAPNNTDPSRMGTLPTPTLRSDTEKTGAQLKEWFLILTQRVPPIEADKLLALREADIRILFDLRELTIEVVGQHDRNKVERLPIWGGLSYSRDHGFAQIIYGEGNLRF